MLTETSTITLAAGETTAMAMAFDHIEHFLRASEHCTSFLLTRHLAEPQRYLVMSWEWDSQRWNAIGWQFVIESLTNAEIEFSVVVNSTQVTANIQ